MMTKESMLISKKLIGKTIVSKTGKTIGKVGDIVFETRTGELVYLLLSEPTSFAASFELEKDKDSIYQIPFSAVIAIGDFVVVSEEDLG